MLLTSPTQIAVCRNGYHCVTLLQVKSVHLNVKTSRVYRALRSRGVEQRNTGLDWIRTHCVTPKTKPECLRGVLYFMDDDNKYDLRLFEEVSVDLFKKLWDSWNQLYLLSRSYCRPN